MAGWAGELALGVKRGWGEGNGSDRNCLQSRKARITAECVFWKTMPIGDLEEMSNSGTIMAIRLINWRFQDTDKIASRSSLAFARGHGITINVTGLRET